MRSQIIHWIARLPRAAALALILLAPPAWAQFRIADIRIEGLQRVPAGTVFSHLPIQVNDTVSEDVTAEIIRALYATGDFDDVQVRRADDVLVIQVRERPAIAQIDLVGNQSIKTEVLKQALKDIGLAEGRTFKRMALDRIEQELRQQYLMAGKYGVGVTSTVSPLERNRVAVRIEIAEGLTARIKKINLVGNRAFDERTLLKQFNLGTSKWHSFYSQNDRYAKEKLAGDLEALRSFYLDRGYIEFQITATQISISPDRQDIYVTIALDEGEQYLVSDIRLAGDPSMPAEQLFPLIRMRRGEPYSRKAATESAERLAELLGNEGYAFAHINPMPELDKENKRVAVTFYVDPGKRVYVRRINMKGNTRTRDEVLRRELRQIESAWFSADLVRRSRERLQRLGYFEDVRIETSAVPGAPDLVDLDITVKERPSGNLMAGIGYSQSQGILFNTSISQNNFLGTGKRVSLAFNTSSSIQFYQFAYTNPYYTIDGISRGFDLNYRATDFDDYIGADYSTDVGIAEINFSLPITDTSRVGLSARYQYTLFYAGKDSELAQHFINCQYSSQAPGKGWANNGQVCSDNDKFNDFFLTASYIQDSRDSSVFPTRGTLQRFMGEIAVPGSDLQYSRWTYRGQHYVPLTRRFTLALRADLGYGAGYGDTEQMPFFENFYAGGPYSVRGWRANSLGPREVGENDDPVGGNLKLAGSIELFAPPPVGGKYEKTLRLGAFFDFGNVWWMGSVPRNAGRDLIEPSGFDLGELRYSTGVSVAWLSPIGALALSFAVPLNARNGDDKQAFQFSLGQTF